MDEGSSLPSALPFGINFRSMGMKLIVVCALALFMTIPALFVGGLVEERTRRAADVVQEISGHVGGQQTFLGPTLAIPYTIPPESPNDTAKHGMYLVFPATASAALKTATEERRRSLFKVPVFQADLKLDATFDLSGVPSSAPQGAALDWSRAEFVVGVSDARGAETDALLTANGKTSTLVPAAITQYLDIGGEKNQSLKLTLFGARAAGIATPNARFDVTSAMRFSGAQRVAVLAYGNTTHLTAQGDWPSPGFDGGFLPITRQVSNRGFTAEWSVPFIARSVRAEGPSDSIPVSTLLHLPSRSLKWQILINPSPGRSNMWFSSWDCFSSPTLYLKLRPASGFIPHNTFWWGLRRSSFICCCCRWPSESASTLALCSRVLPPLSCFRPMPDGYSPADCRGSGLRPFSLCCMR